MIEPMSRENSDSSRGPMGLVEAVAHCAQLVEMMAALEEVYRHVDADVTDAPASCLGGGACCRFDLAGHRLYVSTAELAMLARRKPSNNKVFQRLRCPYQAGPRCTARASRPLGCRTFFCRHGGDDWSSRTYEIYHAQIKALHDKCGAHYVYVELTEALGEMYLTEEKAVDTAGPRS